MEESDLGKEATVSRRAAGGEDSPTLTKEQKLEEERMNLLEKEVRRKHRTLVESTRLPWKHGVSKSDDTWRVTLSFKTDHSSGQYLIEKAADSRMGAYRSLTKLLDNELEALKIQASLLGIFYLSSIQCLTYSYLSTAVASGRNKTLDFEIKFSCPEPDCVVAYIQGFSKLSLTLSRQEVFIMKGRECISRCSAMQDLETKCYRKWSTPKDSRHR